jgi:hypothetical protein
MNAREKKYLRAIKTLKAAAEAMSELPIADARGGDDPRFNLCRDIEDIYGISRRRDVVEGKQMTDSALPSVG